MRITLIVLAGTAALLCALPPAANAQNPSQLLQGLLPGNQGGDQQVREAFERGYRQGREDQAREDRARFDRDRRPPPPPPPPRGPYPDQDPNQRYQGSAPYNR